MPTYTILAHSSSAWVYQTGVATSPLYVGYDTTPQFYEIGLAFDTSGVVGTVTSVTLSMNGTNNTISQSFTLEARLDDWGSSLTTSDWLSGSAFGALPLLASIGSGSITFSGLNAFTSQSAFATSINQSGFTRLIISTDRHRLGTQSGVSYIGFFYPTGTNGQDPQLVITTVTTTIRPITGQADMSMSTSGAASTSYVAYSGSSSYSAYARRVSGSVWEQIAAPMPGGGRYEVGAATLGGKLYALGGWTSNGSVYDSGKRVEAYDPTLNVWTAKANMPGVRTGGGVAVVGSYLYYVGGFQPVTSNPHTNLWRYDPSANTWTSLAAITPAPTAYLTVAIGDPVHNKLYCCETGSTTLYIYDIATDVWSTATKPDMLIPSGTWHSNGKAYFITPPAWTSAPDLFYEYDPVAATFTAKATDSSRYACAMFSFDGKVWVAGGATMGVDAAQTVHSYDPTSNTWTVQDDLTMRRQSVNGDVLDGHPVIAGGYSDGLPWPDYALASAERYAPPQDSSVEFVFGLDPLYPMKLMEGELSIGLELDGDGRVDPQRMNPGFLHIGHRPVGYRDRTYFSIVSGGDLPLPAPDAADIWVDGGTQDRAPIWLDEFAYATSVDGRYLYIISGYWWGNSYTWEQWWSNRTYRWDCLNRTWTELAHLPGYVGSEGCVGALIGDKIYVLMSDTGDDDVQPFGVGGDAPDPEWVPAPSSSLQSMWVYDITADTWARGTQPPFALDYGGCAALGGKLYAVPNWDGVAGELTQGFYVYDPVADTWTRLADTPLQSDDSPAMWGADGKVWYVSRIYNVWNQIIWSYDPGTDTWADETPNFAGAPELLPGYAPATLIVSPTVVRLVGGGGGGSGNNGKTTVEIDVVAKTVVDLNIQMTEEDSYFGGGYYNGKMFVVMAAGDTSTIVEESP